MANFSYSINRGAIETDSAVTAGTLAPGAGDVEIRIKDTNSITKKEVEIALKRLFQFLDSSVSASNSLL